MNSEALQNLIKKNIRIGFEFGRETTKRTEKWQYPLPAIREFLLNAVVHRDYTNPTDLNMPYETVDRHIREC